MRLTRLIVQGFKSFKDRTTIHFDDGITGIVGPNGCGKSNIVDALFWVMGAMSAKHLRGDTMKDVIFAGSSKYTPASWAEVSLVLENDEKKHIHIGNKISNPHEIQLTRKLYRNSETEYRINGVPCRLRDIQEVFMDTGAGAKSYSIIAQGEIERLVQAKPQERRTMIEEVAGITKFKMRRRESLRKIEQTKYNLARLSDLQQEIEKNLNNLKEQAEKAEKATIYRDKITKNELLTEANKVCKLLKSRRESAQQLINKTTDLESWKTRMNTLELGLEDERILKDEFQMAIDEHQRIFNDLSKLLASAEARVEFIKKTKDDKLSQLDRATNENKILESESVETTVRLEELKVEKDALENKLLEDHDFSDLELLVENLKTQMEEKSEIIFDLTQNIEDQKEKKQGYDQNLYRNTDKQKEMSNSLQDIAAEIEGLEEQYSGVSSEIAKERELVKKSEDKMNGLFSEKDNFKETIDLNTKEAAILEKSYKENLKKLLQVESNYNSLKELNNSLEGMNEGAVEFLKSDKSKGYELIGNIIKCEDKYTKAVQRSLSEIMDVVISDIDDNNGLFEWSEQNSSNSLDFLLPTQSSTKNENIFSSEVVDRLKIQLEPNCSFQDGDEENIISINDILSINENFYNDLKPLFEGHYLVQGLTLSACKKLSNDINFKSLVSFDGNIVIRKSYGTQILGLGTDHSLNQGIISRNNKISQLEKEIIISKDRLSEVEEKLSTINKKLENDINLYDHLKDTFAEAKADFAGKISALKLKVSSFENRNTRLEILKNRKTNISKSRLEYIENEEVLRKNLEETEEKLLVLSTTLDDEMELKMNFQIRYQEENDLLIKKQVEANSLSDRFDTALSRVKDFEYQATKNENKKEANLHLIKTLKEEISNLNEEDKNLSLENKAKSNKLQECEGEMAEQRETLVKLMQEMQERENEVKKLTRDINYSEKKMIEHDIKLEQYNEDEEQIVRNIFEKYQIDLRDTVAKYLNYSEKEFEGLRNLSDMYSCETENGLTEIEKKRYEFNPLTRKEENQAEEELKKSKTSYSLLGDINWQAINEYRRQKLRYDFLNEQEIELKQSLENLESAIEHIDNKSRDRFKFAFKEVSSRFEKVFSIVFGGGSAILKIVGDLNDPECGVDIIAQPPGKKMQNINLMSGGEKALTAVSLIFSIFLVKPSPFCLLDEVDAPLDDANVGRFNELLREMSVESQFILITHNKKTMEMNDTLYGITMEEPGISKAVSVQLH